MLHISADKNVFNQLVFPKSVMYHIHIITIANTRVITILR